MSRARTWFAVALALTLVALAVGTGSDDEDPEPSTVASGPSADLPDNMTVVEAGYRPLNINLSEGSATSANEDAGPPVVDGEALTDAEVAAILERVGGDPVQGTTSEFERPAETLAPPLVAENVEQQFPPEATGGDAPDATQGPLEVVRYTPEGDVDIAPFVTVVFNQPMVPIATLDQLEAVEAPITIEPPVAGRWQWIGTNIARFDHESQAIDRLPMATEYTVTIPAGTTSQTGGELAETVEFSFSTPPARVVSLTPSDEQLPPSPIFVAAFDQLVDAADVLSVTNVTANGAKVEIRQASADEVAQDERAQRQAGRTLDGRWVAFTPVAPMPADAQIVVDFGPDLPSAEGPLVNDLQRFTARTFPPLELQRTSCWWDDCPPQSPWSLEFSTQLDIESFDPAWVSVSPAVPGLRAVAEWQNINITGAFAAETTYTVTVEGQLADVFGQTLGDDATVEIEVSSPRPRLYQVEQQIVTVDPYTDTPTLEVSSVEHDELRVTVYEREADQWAEYRRVLDERYREEWRLPDWPVSFERTIEVERGDGYVDVTPIDLSEAIGESAGHAVVVVEPVEAPRGDERWENRPVVVWVQRTDIGIDAFSTPGEVMVWTTDLATGTPLNNVEVRLGPTGDTAATDVDGLADLVVSGSRGSEYEGVVVATAGNDTALLPHWGWEQDYRRDQLIWHTFTDRGVYRPGETVRVKGWVRNLTLAGDAQIELPGQSAPVEYRAYDPQGNEIASGTASLSSLGGFDLSLDIPEGANLGYAWLELNISGRDSNGVQFRIEEFRRPEFEVRTWVDTPGPYLLTEPATAGVGADYYSGGPLGDSEVEWRVSTREASYSPPGHDDFSFGVWTPWWWRSGPAIEADFYGDGFYGDEFYFEPGFDSPDVETFVGRTDARGEHYLRLDFSGGTDDLPSTVSAQATVYDVNRQSISSTTDLLVHPSDVYVGLRSTDNFVRPGETLEVEALAVDIDGEVVPGTPLSVQLARIESRFVGGEWTEVAIDPETCDVVSDDEPVVCEFTPVVGGTYKITALATDDAGRTNRSELTRWVYGVRAEPQRTLEQQELTLVPDAQEYEPGGAAEILVQAPFAEGSGLVTITRNGIESTQTFVLDDGSAVVEVAIAEDDIPNLGVQIDVAGSAERVDDSGDPIDGAPARPAFATASIDLPISKASRQLTVDVTPADSATVPGAATSVDVTVTGPDGQPVADAELAVVVVDEAILALTAYDFADPLATFYRNIGSQMWTIYGRSSLVLANPDEFGQNGGADGESAATTTTMQASADLADGDDAMEEAASDEGGADTAARAGAVAPGGQPIELRTNFDALAVFEPEVVTDAEGSATIDVPLPDTLTRYRVFVAAASGDRLFGSGDSNITARLPLQVRPAAPRFANFGDEFELPVVIANQTDEAMTVDVAVEAGNLSLTDVAGKRIAVPANDRVEVRFDMTTESAGEAAIRIAAVADCNLATGCADAAQVELPVYTPATAEAFATYGVVDDGPIAQAITTPTGVIDQFGGLEVTTSSTAVSALTDSVLYLWQYRYASSDALASQIMTIAALRDVLEAFEAEGLPPAAEIDAAVDRYINELLTLQTGDGGFASWSQLYGSSVYHSIQATHALVVADKAGYQVPRAALDRALGYLVDVEARFEPEWSQDVKDSLSAYALHVRHEAGQTDTAKAVALYNRAGDTMQLDSLAMLWPLIGDQTARDAIERRIINSAVDTAAGATFSTSYGDDAYVILHSDRRSDGVILGAMISEAPSSDLIPKVVNGLLGSRTAGRWDNVQENAFILLALNDYFATFESVEPDFVARAWLDELHVAEHAYEGRVVDGAETLVPMELLTDTEADTSTLVMARDGEGRLYYRLGLRYAPDDFDLDPVDRGFVVTRTYEAIDNPDDVWRDDEGVWHVRAGAGVRVNLTMTAESRRTQVALVDPMPAGFEALNPSLATTGVVDDGGEEGISNRSSWWWWRWFEHQNLRDDRAEAITSYLGAGTYDYSYVVRATTPGTFVVPPAYAEEIYAPETFGRTASTKVVVFEQ